MQGILEIGIPEETLLEGVDLKEMEELLEEEINQEGEELTSKRPTGKMKKKWRKQPHLLMKKGNLNQNRKESPPLGKYLELAEYQ